MITSNTALRVFKGDDAPPVINAGATISQLFESLHKPALRRKKAADATFAEYRTHLKGWQAFWAAGGPAALVDRHSDCLSDSLFLEPPAAEVSGKVLLAFRDWLSATRKIGDRQLNKYLCSIQAILGGAAKEGEISAVPILESLDAEEAGSILYMSYEEVSALYRAADSAPWPTLQHGGGRWGCKPLPFSPGDYWRAAIVVWFNFGLRTQELWAYERGHSPLAWDNVRWDRRSPAADGRAECDWGWLWYVPQKQRRKKSKAVVLPMNRVVHHHLRVLSPPAGAAKHEAVIPAAHRQESFLDTWDYLCRVAGIRPKPSIDGGDQAYKPKHLRQTCATWHDYNRPNVSPLILGHAKRGNQFSVVTDKHYRHAELAILDAVSTLPQPDVFQTIFERRDRQRRLFS